MLSKSIQLAKAVAAALYFMTVDAETADSNVKWGYDPLSLDMLPPSRWGDKFPACYGKRQSPIALETSERCETDDVRQEPLRFDGSCSGFHLKQFDDVFKGEVLNGTCTVSAKDGEPFSLLQFHMHAPSEHTLDGKAFDAEAHFVHKNDAGKLLVVGLFVEKREDKPTNKWIKDVWCQLDQVHANKSSILELESYHELLVAKMQSGVAFHYQGSLTAPPCDEIVDWWVLQEPVIVSATDFDKFIEHSTRLPALDDGQGSRPTQPLNGRTVHVF